MIRPKGLGRGLDALLSGGRRRSAKQTRCTTIAIDRIQPGKYQPRTRMDDAALAELAESIRAQGVMQPILVRPIEGGRFEIIAGERRWRAAQRAGLAEVPGARARASTTRRARDGADREHPARGPEPARGGQRLQRLIDEFGLTHDAAAKAVGRSRARCESAAPARAAKPVQG